MNLKYSPLRLFMFLIIIFFSNAAHSKDGILLYGGDTVVVFRTNGYPSICYPEITHTTFEARDSLIGDITYYVVVTSNLDCSVVGQYWTKFKVTLSGGKVDSAMRVIIVRKPYGVPNNNFYTGSNQTEIYYQNNFYSLADSGAYQYEWEFTSPSGNVNNSNYKNPTVTMDEYGKWTACFRARNDIGWSSWSCKTVWCVPPYAHYLGPEHLTQQDSGVLYDNGGPDVNYGNNRKKTVDYFTINTTADKASLWIRKMKFADTGDRLKIYEGRGDTGKALHPAGGFTFGNVPSIPKKLTSNTGCFYVTFESNGSGTDTGFALEWKSLGNFTVQGNVYFDRDSNCKFDRAKEASVPSGRIWVNKKYLTTPLRSGFYTFTTDSASKEIKPELPAGWYVSCPASGKDTWNYTRTGEINFGIRPDPSKPRLDISSRLVPRAGYTVTRGFESELDAELLNIGNKILDSGICRLKFSKKMKSLKLKSGSYTATDTTLEFRTGRMDYFGFSYPTIKYTPYSTDTGYFTVKCSFLPLGSGNKDIDSSNNFSAVKLKIVYAHDPNDKQVSEPERMDGGNKKLTYFVRFQNTGTAPATDVIVRDTLSPLLDTNSLEFVTSSHYGFMERKGYALAFKFLNINLIDSHHNEKESHGYFYYSIHTSKSLQPYEKIKNTAHIYFDFEKPVTTNTTVNYWVHPPVVAVNGDKTQTITVCETFYDPGATAYDIIDGNLTQMVKRIGKYTNHAAGKYPLKYYAVNAYGDTGWASRLLIIVDEDKPHIRYRGSNIRDQMQVFVQIAVPFIDSVYAEDSCLGRIPLQGVPGFNGPVNSYVKGAYPVTYFAKDAAGNKAFEDSFTILYKVEDYIPPIITQNSPDTICHQINTTLNLDSVKITDNYYPRSQISLKIRQNVNVFEKGIYFIIYEATDGSGNIGTLTKYIRVEDCQGVSGIQKFENRPFSVYPNPASHEVQINFNQPGNGNLYIQITSLTGATLLQKNMIVSQKTNLDVSGLPAGTCMISVTQNGQTQFQKLIIFH